MKNCSVVKDILIREGGNINFHVTWSKMKQWVNLDSESSEEEPEPVPNKKSITHKINSIVRRNSKHKNKALSKEIDEDKNVKKIPTVVVDVLVW